MRVDILNSPDDKRVSNRLIQGEKKINEWGNQH